ncbi:MAG: hypothetical protein A3C06_02795 [Candidatus Taylorbacteria bacterium RIFCSPHIGHO2_02_FULL_46_13]|uniref:Uncharacterized protein n=1 Tax=Candidatus Taylorbacteria bacterium RIFCSPHIGHO2_02_FULL_46_13 TaxID=1802312 RepID=A0A1G2MRG2_9BACT|nr:MAG: hypothetical protein A3C06_02795 [Candidatus Taylorbacteria bacterium RIFCSPHIGHO2_02_FULL_46_13]
MSQVRIPNVDTLADCLDRLIVEVNKLSYFENKKREEHAKPNKDAELIAFWDNKSRDCCEFRSLLKNKINEILSEIVSSKEYKTLREARTFAPPKERLSDFLARRCEELGTLAHTGKLAKILEKELVG